MGLGKTLQTIAFLSAFATTHPNENTLVIVPPNVLHNWQAELKRWLPRGGRRGGDGGSEGGGLTFRKVRLLRGV